jgi:hypothetical protein
MSVELQALIRIAGEKMLCEWISLITHHPISPVTNGKYCKPEEKKFFLKEPFACQGNWWWHIPSLLNKKLFPSEPGTYFLEALGDQDE